MTTVGRVEITDLLWCRDEHGVRQPVLRSQVVARLEASGQRRAARIVARMPASDDVLDPEHVDVLAVRVHCELQRLAEELQFGRRVAALLRPEVQRLREQAPGPVRVVDVGCGLGFLVRSLAHEQALGRVSSSWGSTSTTPSSTRRQGWPSWSGSTAGSCTATRSLPGPPSTTGRAPWSSRPGCSTT